MALSVSMGTQLGSSRVVLLGCDGGMEWVVSTIATIRPSGKHAVMEPKPRCEHGGKMYIWRSEALSILCT